MDLFNKARVHSFLAFGLLTAAAMLPRKNDVARAAVVATDLNLSAVSSYVFRGVTINHGPAFQPNVELSAMQASLGLWGSFSLDRRKEETKQEIEVYLRYGIPVGFAELTLGVWEYMYPEDKTLDNDREIELTATMDNLPWQPRLSIFRGLHGAVEENTYVEFSLNEDLLDLNQLSVSLGFVAGYIDMASAGKDEDGFTHGMISLGASYQIIDASFNWIIETDDRLNDLSGQKDFYAQISSGFSF